MTGNAFVIVSGLPASGKSTLAHQLAAELGWSVIGDDILFTLAAQARRAVLDNWWHHDTAPSW
ncbi:AAA family ATPase [Streptomyces sp. H27-H1]|uniref:AAA family ATPase n=1 Tax=Streptomyces sp. H27-H1 TaxID=2996461 RepID=UPI002270CF9B|nr:AAA family ATPase [Streptomyces sp. H27-H1]MCY0928990.1 AAA family ATPase [Streptomyces sp. H27-H1]